MRVAIIGGGIVGLATAFKVQKLCPNHEVLVIEKEASVGAHQSSHNSGVLHAGLYYKPGSFKAKLAVRGIRLMKEFCLEHGIPHETCGKLVVATDARQLAVLDSLFERGQLNGLSGLQKLDKAQMREIEPHVGGVAALHVPEEGIVDYRAVCGQLSKLITGQGGAIQLRSKVTGFSRSGSTWRINTDRETHEVGLVINTAGLYCDKICQLAGNARTEKIIPFRGEYFKIKPERSHLVRNLIYPVPDPQFPFLGVHFTRMVHGGIEAGPNAVLAFAREGYSKTDIHLGELAEALAYPGLWRFIRKHWRMCWIEVWQSLNKRRFCQALQKLVPEIQESDLTVGGAGVRAQAMSLDGSLVQDFLFVKKEGMLHVLNAPSPGATASLAIGEEIVNEVQTMLNN